MDSTQMKIFYSWQSDLPNSNNRNLIQGSIDKTVKKFSNIIKIEADRDTKSKLGSPDITKTIFEKIDESDLFIADITMINKSKYKFLRDKKRATPNPNVLIELGYAAKTLGWERIICVYNTDYSPLDSLPFDLRQHRITSYSIKKDGKSKSKDIIVEILSETINKLAECGNLIRAKNGKSHHKIVGYNFNENKIEDKVYLYHPVDFCNIKSELIDASKELVKNISKIRFDYTQKDVDIEEKLEKSVSLPQLFGKYNLVKIDDKTKAETSEQVKMLLGIDLDDEFFFMGKLKRKYDVLNRCDYSGEELEIHKYELYMELESTLLKIEVFDEYIKTFDNMSFVPLAITNDSSEVDKDINIEIVVEGEKFELITPTQKIISENLIGSEGAICEYGFIPELFGLPEDFSVKYDGDEIEVTVPAIDTRPKIGLWGDLSEYDEEDYENELKAFVATPNSRNSYIFKISSLQPQETKWLGGVLLLTTENTDIKISYSIRSNHSDGSLVGKMN